MSKVKLAALLLLPVVIGLIVGIWLSKNGASDPQAQKYAAIGGDFTLQSAHGPVSLKDFRGKVAVIYFGYTACPDICPTSLGMMATAFRSLSRDELDQVQGIFISVDPERDTPEVMDKYATFFHPKILGLTGTPQDIAKVAKKYAVYYKKARLEGSAMGYGMDHSSSIYIVGKNGQIADIVAHGAKPASIAEAIRKAM
ncbi:MAG: SCO family protein [Gammaproteobacteria bacterium]|nr:MAG: SCO family protein [Gammaproteobacteria bacterium]